ncbi:putative Alpha/beta hydrolase [Mycena leptocephala]|nr:putative Alpha/beta hydrolase [Mycena leptocephala]
MSPTEIKSVVVDSGISVFYRTASPADNPAAPTILLLHGFPTSSHQYRNLIPLLASITASSLPTFRGSGSRPSPRNETTPTLSPHSAPLSRPSRQSSPRTAMRTQTDLVRRGRRSKSTGATGSAEDRAALVDGVLTYDTTKWQYTHGTRALDAIAPETYTLDWALLQRPGNFDIQLDLFKDYQNNVALYPQFQEYFRKSQVPLLAVWGKHDAFFIPPGAEAFKRDLPKAEVIFLDAGHFAGETETAEIARLMVVFLKKVF